MPVRDLEHISKFTTENVRLSGDVPFARDSRKIFEGDDIAYTETDHKTILHTDFLFVHVFQSYFICLHESRLQPCYAAQLQPYCNQTDHMHIT
jgi:hypothetical protein